MYSILGTEYKAVFAVSISPMAAFLSSFVHAGRRLGMIEGGHYYKGSRLLFSEVYNAPFNEHVSKRFDNLFSLQLPGFSSQKTRFQSIEQSGTPYVLIHPGGKWRPRRWPPENYWEIMLSIAQNGYPVKIVVHHSEGDLLDFFAERSLPNQVTLCKTNKLEDLISLVKGCTLYLGNDSGPMHLANLYSKKTVILWGPGNYMRIRPIGSNNTIIMKDIACRPCRQYIHPDRCERGNNVCMQLISTEEVCRIVEEKLRELSWE
jgi:ADP-heptose:LPS heptosyltransferase